MLEQCWLNHLRPLLPITLVKTRVQDTQTQTLSVDSGGTKNVTRNPTSRTYVSSQDGWFKCQLYTRKSGHRGTSRAKTFLSIVNYLVDPFVNRSLLNSEAVKRYYKAPVASWTRARANELAIKRTRDSSVLFENLQMTRNFDAKCGLQVTCKIDTLTKTDLLSFN